MPRKPTTNSKIQVLLENIFYPEGQLEEMKKQDPERHKFRVEQLERAAKAINVVFLGDKP